MSDTLNRRQFVAGAAAAAAGLPLTAAAAQAAAQPIAHLAPAAHGRSARPVVIASDNGHASRGADGRTCVETAFALMAEGRDVLEALVEGVGIVERDPADTSVGYGGLPNGDGVVQLDASVMHGPRRRAGAVAALEGVRTPAAVAHAVMLNTDHHLLVGAGAQRFARQLGFTIEDDLNTDESRRLWLEFRRRIDPARWLDPDQRTAAALDAGLSMVRDGLIDRRHFHGTIHASGVNAAGDVCAVTTTSGLAWKIPGRVGDSPILGAGIYVDNDVGAAGSTGRGEANLYNLSSFLIVENMRRGMAPKDAGMDALRRVRRNTVERRLLDENGLPNFDLDFYILTARGEYAAVSLFGGWQFAVCDANGARLEEPEALLTR